MLAYDADPLHVVSQSRATAAEAQLDLQTLTQLLHRCLPRSQEMFTDMDYK